jgi:hypothetical protein
MAQMYTQKNAKEVEKFIQEKQQLEWDLAKDIMATFDQPEIVKQLRFYADAALSNLIEIVMDARDASILLNKAIVMTIDGERKRTLKVLKDYKGFDLHLQLDAVAQLEGLRAHLPEYGAATIAEIIRLYGGVIEAAAKGPAKDVWKKSTEHYAKKKTAFDEAEGQFVHKGGAKAKQELEALLNAMTEYAEKKYGNKPMDQKLLDSMSTEMIKAAEEIIKNKKLDTLRDGWRKGGGSESEGLDAAAIWRAGRARYSVVNPKEVAQFHAAREAWGVGNVQTELDKLKGGQSLFSLKDSSTIGKIDHTFGLVPAADISGTTTDTVFFFEQANCGDPIFNMLPLGPVVAGGHHSFVECAIALSLAGKCDYSIGKYTTVLPEGSKIGKDAMLKVLQKAENDPRNRRLVVAYDGTKKPAAIQHAWVFDPNDKRFDAFAHWRRNMEYFKKAKGEPEGWFTKEILEAELKKATLVT